MHGDLLLEKLKPYYPATPDLMRHLEPGSCWEYIINKKTLDDEEPELVFFLRKKNDGTIELLMDVQSVKPDLLLYFTEKAILTLINGAPAAEEYYARYRKIMEAPQADMDLDFKLNKSKIQLFKTGYKRWQDAFKFSNITSK